MWSRQRLLTRPLDLVFEETKSFEQSVLNLSIIYLLFFLIPPTTLQENQTALAMSQAECRDVLHRLLPHVPLPTEQVWKEFEFLSPTPFFLLAHSYSHVGSFLLLFSPLSEPSGVAPQI